MILAFGSGSFWTLIEGASSSEVCLAGIDLGGLPIFGGALEWEVLVEEFWVRTANFWSGSKAHQNATLIKADLIKKKRKLWKLSVLKHSKGSKSKYYLKWSLALSNLFGAWKYKETWALGILTTFSANSRIVTPLSRTYRKLSPHNSVVSISMGSRGTSAPTQFIKRRYTYFSWGKAKGQSENVNKQLINQFCQKLAK